MERPDVIAHCLSWDTSSVFDALPSTVNGVRASFPSHLTAMCQLGLLQHHRLLALTQFIRPVGHERGGACNHALLNRGLARFGRLLQESPQKGDTLKLLSSAWTRS
jgi:hypothetical protein